MQDKNATKTAHKLLEASEHSVVQLEDMHAHPNLESGPTLLQPVPVPRGQHQHCIYRVHSSWRLDEGTQSAQKGFIYQRTAYNQAFSEFRLHPRQS